MHNMDKFDFSAPAELFASKGRGAGRRPMTYHRFDSSADAIRFAIEELPAAMLVGAVLESGDERYGAAAIRAFYDSAGYPFHRQK